MTAQPDHTVLGSPCPRCGKRAPVGDGPFCPWCGRYMAVLRWVASPPQSAHPQLPVAPRPRYHGPPRYRTVPRWGFPVGPWTPPEGAAETPVPPLVRASAVAATLVPMLRATAAVCLIATGAEIWRYVLLVASRADALPAAAVNASDALVASAGTVATILTVVVGALLVLWSVRATEAAAEAAGVRPARTRRSIVVGWVVPGANLVVPGPLLAEIEHTALGLPAAQRPRPSMLVRAWWVLWTCSVVLAVAGLLWNLRGGVQALADGVVLHAVIDLLAVATAIVTANVVMHLTRLLGPSLPPSREIVVAVRPPGALAAPE